MLDVLRAKHIEGSSISIFYGLALVLLGAIAAFVVFDIKLLLLIPFILLLVIVYFIDSKIVYYLLWATIPISIQFYFPNGLGTDLPSEPLMVMLMVGFIGVGIWRVNSIPVEYALHPITILLLLHFFWIFLTALVAEDMIIAIKFLLAKMWYMVTFYFGSLYLLRSFKDYKRLVLSVLIPLVIIVFVILVKHSMEGFTFVSANYVINPYFRNHVDYASLLVVFLPFVWFYYKIQVTENIYVKLAMFITAIILLTGISFSYTRAAFVSVGLIAVSYYLIRYRVMKYALIISILLSSIWVTNLVNNNRYLKYAPNYEQTVAHKDFESLLSATYKLKDISTMERVYRWVAGFRMVSAHPWMGFGPNGFYPNYKPYTIRAFETYVSDNPEKSGVHSYYLMTAVEQGIPGLIIFALLNILSLLFGESVYHRIRDKRFKVLVMSAMLSQIGVLSILLINDMIETVKVGPFFFLNLAIIAGVDILHRRFKTLEYL